MSFNAMYLHTFLCGAYITSHPKPGKLIRFMGRFCMLIWDPIKDNFTIDCKDKNAQKGSMVISIVVPRLISYNP